LSRGGKKRRKSEKNTERDIMKGKKTVLKRRAGRVSRRRSETRKEREKRAS
jgi:hypothetical protein